MGFFRLQAMLVVTLIVGCAPYEMQAVQGEPRPDPAGHAQTQHEQKPGELTGEAKVSGNTVNVLVQKTTMCRDVTTTPMVADTTTEKKLKSEGRGAQYLLGGGAVLLAAAGTAFVAGPCTKKDTDAAGKSIERDCTSQEQKDQKNSGVGMIVLGGALGGMFIVNVVRAQDERGVTPLPPSTTETPWKKCESASARSATVTLDLHGKTLTAQTDGDGIARFDLARIDGTPEDVEDPKAVVQAGAKTLAHVDLGSTPAFAKWKTDVQARRAEEEVEIDAARKQRVAAAKERQRKEWGELRQRINAVSAVAEAGSSKLKKIRAPWNASKFWLVNGIAEELLALLKQADADAFRAKLVRGQADTDDVAAATRYIKAVGSWNREFERLKPGLVRWAQAQSSQGTPGLESIPSERLAGVRQELDELRAQQKRSATENERERKRLEGELRDQQRKNDEQRRDDERKRKQERYSKEMACLRDCDHCGSYPTEGCLKEAESCRRRCNQQYGD